MGKARETAQSNLRLHCTWTCKLAIAPAHETMVFYMGVKSCADSESFARGLLFFFVVFFVVVVFL